MAWTTPPTFTNSVLTAAQLNILSSDLNETAAAKATTAGSIFVGTGVNGLVERFPNEVTEFANETTTSTTYANLPTVGPNCTVTTGTRALVGVTCTLNNNTAGWYSLMSVAVYTPPSTPSVVADDNYAVLGKAEGTVSAAAVVRASAFRMLTGLTSQSNLFQGKYRVGGGTGTFDDRSVLVIPL